LFSAAKRDFSHGCVRVDEPFRLADVVLPTWSEERLKKLIGKGERTIRLPEKLPVHLAYFTTYVDDGGALRSLPDLYGYDAPMRAALGLPGGGGPAIAKLPDEAPRKKVVSNAAPQPRAARRPDAHRRVADDGPERRYEEAFAHRRSQRRSAGAEVVEYGEPGLWTPGPAPVPAPAPVSRGWW
jgi:L,D-transpeptidase YcbB